MYNSILEDFKNAWRKPNNAGAQIIIINVIVFVLVNLLNVISDFSSANLSNGFSGLLMIPASIEKFLVRPWTLITYFFTHEGLFHLLSNMLFLYWFGKLIQEFLGSKKLIALYVLGGIAGGLFYLLMYNLVPYYQVDAVHSRMLGASAGVFAVVVGAAVFMPDYTFFLFLFGPVKIKYIALVYVVISFFGITGSNSGGDLAHLAGAGVGWLYITQMRKGSDIGLWVIQFISWVKSFFIAGPKIKVTHKARKSKPSRSKPTSSSSVSANTSATPNQEEIDAILDKISQRGYDSLTKDEKQKLFNASKE